MARFSDTATALFVDIAGMAPSEAAGLRYLTTVDGSKLVGVYNSTEAGLHDGEDGCNWATVCERHSTLVGHETYRLALHHACDPSGWCEFCEGERVVVCRSCGTGNDIPGGLPPSDFRCSKCATWLYDEDDPT